MISPVILWTDGLIYLLVLASIGLFFWMRKQAHFKRPLQKVLRRKGAMIALVVLVSYILVGLLDSVHFKVINNNQISPVVSLLDVALGPMEEQLETTYSEPLATHGYAKSAPRLVFGGSHLDKTNLDKIKDIILRLLFGLSLGAVLSSLSYFLIKKYLNKNNIPWKSIWLSVSGVLILLSLGLFFTGFYHILGTDKVGHDVLYQALKSVRTGLVIGTLTTLIMLPFAVILGLAAGYFRGWVDDVIQYIYTTLSSIPGVLLIAAFILALQIYISNHPELFPTMLDRADARLLALCLILGISSWTGLCRLLRAETLKLREMDYVQAAMVLGTSKFKILSKHILPNVMHLILIAVVLDFSMLVLAEAVLSYVGVGVDPTTLSWGNMINGARLELAREPIVWWPLLAAFIFMFGLVLSANIFSDAVRDAFDPRSE